MVYGPSNREPLAKPLSFGGWSSPVASFTLFLGVDSPFFSTIVLPWVRRFIERRIPGKNGEVPLDY